MNIKGIRSDLKIESQEEEKYICISFRNLNNKKKIKLELKKALESLLKEEKLKKNIHFFIVGLGNDNFTADAVGPKVLKSLYVNGYVNQLGFPLQKNKITSLEPGALIETGISTTTIIESVAKSIKPDILICIDSFVCEKVKYLNRCLELTNTGIIPGSGLKSNNKEISKKTIKIPVFTIGVPTALEIDLNGNKYLLSTKDIDEYVKNISIYIAEVLNDLLPTYNLK